jgi:glutaminyl-tRNA synthetase
MSPTSRPEGPAEGPAPPPHFIEQIVLEDNAARKWGVWGPEECGPGQTPGTPRVHTRFPPEPNGYLHVGHTKSICLNFGLAREFGGKFNLRFDDTNPAKEEAEYVEAIKRDVKWLGADWEGPFGGGLHFASNYFGRMYEFAVELVEKGRAYVCELSAEEVSKRRGSPSVPATSPYRNRPAAESLRLLAEMKAGTHPDGSMTLRAKIDLASPNFNLRDPVLYRIVHEAHHNTGGEWCIYPMYDWAHGFEDSIEGITHSICTLEFEDHRPLYNWFIDAVNGGRPGNGRPRIHHPQQIEFAKLRPTYTLLSKRNLLKLVQSGVVEGWDDPRMPTVAGLRRRGVTPEAIWAFCREVGVTKVESWIDVGRLENAVREHLNRVAPRAMAVLRPLRVVVENWPEGKVDWLDSVVNPEDPGAGRRKVPFGRELYIERDDFMESPPKKFYRLAPGQEVRLRWAYFLTCTGVEKDAAGNITLVRGTIDPATRGGDAPLGSDGQPVRKVKGTIHWVPASHAVEARVRLLDRLFTAEEPGKRTGNYMDDLNPASLEEVTALVDPWLASPQPEEPAWADGIRRFQFERLGYFCVDQAAKAGTPVFNRTVTLKDTWAKVAGRE